MALKTQTFFAIWLMANIQTLTFLFYFRRVPLSSCVFIIWASLFFSALQTLRLRFVVYKKLFGTLYLYVASTTPSPSLLQVVTPNSFQTILFSSFPHSSPEGILGPHSFTIFICRHWEGGKVSSVQTLAKMIVQAMPYGLNT